MHANARNSAGRSMAVLHPAFALTGVLHAIGGPLLPSLAATFHLNDSRSGLLFLLYFGGTSLLIVVGVAMDTVQQIEAQLVMRNYDGFVKKGKLRGRRYG